jgi:hypothetical protein
LVFLPKPFAIDALLRLLFGDRRRNLPPDAD